MLILSGGGAHPKTKKTIDWLSNTYERLRVLYVPQARESDNNYSECIEWLTEELNNPQYTITLLETKEWYNFLDYIEYDMLYIGGGNIEKLLKFVKESNLDKLIEYFLSNNNVIMGGSAGAIIFGNDCKAYRNSFCSLSSYEGFASLGDISLACHYMPDYYISQFNACYFEVIERYSKENKTRILGLPEETSIIVNDEDVFVIGGDAYLFDGNGVKKIFEGEHYFKCEF